MLTETLPADYYQSARPVIGDWGKTVSFTPRIYVAPTSIDELTSFLNDTLPRLPEGASLRVLGGLHSCSEIFVSDVVIDTSRLPLEFEATLLPGGAGTVVASAHMHVHDLLYRAAAHDLSLTATGGADAQTLAGLIATNTAGAMVYHGVYETVDWVEYLTVAPDGKSIVLKRVGNSEPEFRAVICSLGVIGFVLRIGFTLVKQVYYQCEYHIQTLSQVLDDTVKTNGLYDFWRIEWIPDTDFVQLWTATPIDGRGDPNVSYPDDKD
jgi:FAD/FMN-containing dehydrogenase